MSGKLGAVESPNHYLSALTADYCVLSRLKLKVLMPQRLKCFWAQELIWMLMQLALSSLFLPLLLEVFLLLIMMTVMLSHLLPRRPLDIEYSSLLLKKHRPLSSRIAGRGQGVLHDFS